MARSNSLAPGEFPLQLREGLIWVDVQAQRSARPLRFVVDSGAQVSVINLRTATRLGLPKGDPVNVRGVGSVAPGKEHCKNDLRVYYDT